MSDELCTSATVGAKWFADFLRKKRGPAAEELANPGENAPIINSFTGILRDRARERFTEENLSLFEETLAKSFHARLYSASEDYLLCERVDYDPGRLLAHAAGEAGIGDLKFILPMKCVCYMRTTHVLVAVGDEDLWTLWSEDGKPKSLWGDNE